MKNKLRFFLLYLISYGLFSPVLGGFAQDVSFSSPRNFAVGDGPESLAVGDFNRDGNEDLAVTNTNSNTVSIFLGNGDGSFGPATNIPVGNWLNSVVLGDFNGDGRQDLAVAAGNYVSILLGNGDGSFGSPSNFVINPIIPDGSVVAVGDFNRDGKQDLAAASYRTMCLTKLTCSATITVSVLLGNGDGSFGLATNVATWGGTSSSLAIGDFNGDGKQDLVVAKWNIGDFSLPGSVLILLGNGDGSFIAPTYYSVGTDPRSVSIGDFDGDGKQDLAVANDGYSQNVSILLGNGDGSFRAATNFGVTGLPNSVAVEDFNGDGRQDLAVAAGNYSSGIVSVLLGIGNGSFGAPTNVAVGGYPFSVADDDFNGDGKQDVVAANFSADNVSILLNVPAVQKLSNIATRSRVLTGDNAMIGGFIIDGVAPLRVLVRSRGPSMSGAPFFVAGTLANPFLRLFSGQTVIAQNDNWQDPTSCSGFVCEGAAAIVATGTDPCQPNPGQPGPPPNCALESAILITLPPGGYTGIVTGADGGTGVGLVEVFDRDESTQSELSNIATRSFVQTGDNIMIGGLIIEATAPKTVLIRGRGPSMSGAPFNLSGTLANPLLELFSGQTVIAFNDNWRDLQGDEIIATGTDPCLPNPGQTTSPPGCDQESAMVLDLPAGGYTAWLSGVGGQTGIGLVEVFEVSEVIIPNALGKYQGSSTVTLSQCTNPAFNTMNTFFSTINISSQQGSIIGGIGTFSGPATGNLTISGTVTPGFDTMGSFTFTQFTQPGASGSGTFTGVSVGNTITINMTGQVNITGVGTCILNSTASGNR